jgi:hypothetical protein
MPKKPIDYSKCCIYKIEHIENENLLYVGHTTEFNKRKNRHKSNCYNQNDNSTFNLKLYQMIRENGGFEMFKMIEVEKYQCNDRREAERRENEVMKNLKANMNMKPSYVSEEERKEKYKKYYESIKDNRKENYETNKEAILLKHKVYREKNNEKLNNQKRLYYEKNKEKISEQQKEYYKDTIEKRKEYSDQYREKNKEEINKKKLEAYHRDKEKHKDKIKCECGCEVLKIQLKRHEKRKKHIDIMMNKKLI